SWSSTRSSRVWHGPVRGSPTRTRRSARARPDIITSAKGLGGGMPIGATNTVGDANTKLLDAGQHGTTFGGNPLSCAAGLAVLETIEKDNILTHVAEVSDWLKTQLAEVDGIGEITGKGLLLGRGH